VGFPVHLGVRIEPYRAPMAEHPASLSPRARHRRVKVRRRRLLLGLVLAGIVALLTTLASSGGSTGSAAGPLATHGRGAAGVAPTTARLTASAPPAVEAGEFPWQLPAPLSREVVQPGPLPNELVIAGGLAGSGSSEPAIDALDTSDGELHGIGELAQPTHDAAGALLHGALVVIGGGTTAASAVVQRFPMEGAGAPSVSSAATSLGAPRADSTAVTVGGAAYVVGGYRGTSFDPAVLRTTDGIHFSTVARLEVAVRYPAVAALGSRIYVLGGEASDGRPVRTVQVIDTLTHRVAVVGQLPFAIEGAVAAPLDGTIYLAGGETAGRDHQLEPTSEVLALDRWTGALLRAGTMRVAVTNAGAAVLGRRLFIVGGETASGGPSAVVQMIEPNRAFGTAGRPGAGSPFYGEKLLIADRGSNRLLLLNDSDRVIWTYPSARRPPPPGGFYFPDDAFFIHHGTAIISNQEENETIVEIAYPSGRLLWSYGHPRVPGSLPGYLDNPDDAYLLRNGDITVADPMNCRVLVISPAKRILTQIGTPGECVHNPPTELGSPNGDTPLADGNLLVSEINGSWIDEYTTTGHLVWTVHLPIGYPSDPQQLGPDTYLVANYEDPGAFLEFNRAGQILYRYQPSSGSGMLNDPSLVELLPSGVLMANDDHNDRMVAIDPATGALVWQYGVTGHPGTAPGMLDKPDGFDILCPGGTTPTHPATG
jgi:outer membrane protein assembly factor BamB